MNKSLHDRLVRCVTRSLRPLVRILLRAGIGYPQFAELAKLAFVHEVFGEKDIRGRTMNLSRVSVRTGISRKEVARLRTRIEEGSDLNALSQAVDYESLHAARVLQLWHSDARFIDLDGAPRVLPFLDGERDFGTLVKAAGGDVPPGAVRAELLAASAVVQLDDGSLKPTKRHFVPADVGEELLVGFTHMVIPVLEGLARNTDERCETPFIQRLVYSDRLPPAQVPVFRELARERVTGFVQSVDNWLSSAEVPESVAREPQRVGIGVFYYEGPPSVAADAKVADL
jgi:hypothetical protein